MTESQGWEVNFDGMVGPTHNYAGLSFGNVASSAHGGDASSPRQAALQGLEKAWTLADMGFRQAVLPPQERPHIPTLQRLGFTGNDDGAVLANAAKHAPHLLAAASSASCMWVANAATISPFADTEDGKTHITPANLCSMFHRSIEVPETSRVLRAIFADESFVHHPALPSGPQFSDEGAANHSRFCNEYGGRGVELFVYGDDLDRRSSRPQKYPARQTLAACRTIARSHGLPEQSVVFAQQNPQAIDAGVFHNDVIAVGNRRVLFHHELAFADTAYVRAALDRAMGSVLDSALGSAMDSALDYIEVPVAAVSLTDAVRSYLFNSQLLSVPGENAASLIVPGECREVEAVHSYLDDLEANNPHIARVHYVDLRQSMNNGGGPACLRLRVVMSDTQISAQINTQINNTGARVFLDESLYQDLRGWIEKHYRETLKPEELQDPALLMECRTALDELSQLLAIGPVYDFQRESG